MSDLTPITRTEMLLDGQDLTPVTRKEMFLRRLYDETQEIPEPVTREEWFLKKASEGGGGDITVEALNVTDNGTYTAPPGKAYTPVTVEVPDPVLDDITITENGVYTSEHDGFDEVTVDVAPPENSYQLKSITTPTSLATFEASAMPMPSLKVSVEAKQASGVPSPSNPLPISGWDAVVVTDTDDVDNPTVTQTTTIALGQTVYGAEVDVVNGTSGNKLTHGIVDLGDLTWSASTDAQGQFFQTPAGEVTDIKHGTLNCICSCYEVVSSSSVNNGNIAVGQTGRIYVRDNNYSTASDFKTAIAGQTLVYELATPTNLTTQPTPIKSLNGQNNLSVDCGEILEGEYFKTLGGE